MGTPSINTPNTFAPAPISEYEMLKRVSLDMMTTIQFQNTTLLTTNALADSASKVMDALNTETHDLAGTVRGLQIASYVLMGASGLAAAGALYVGAANTAIGQIAGGAITGGLSLPTACLEVRQGDDTGKIDVAQGVLTLKNQQVKSMSGLTSQVIHSQNSIGRALQQTIANDGQAQMRHKKS